MSLDERGSGPDAFYYLKNFQAMIGTLQRRDGDLLDDEERSFIDGFGCLPPRAQALLVRMVMRKGTLFRASRLVYPEIVGVTEAVAPLVRKQWVDARPRLTLDELFRLLTKPALAEYLALPRQQAALPKAVLLDELRDAFPGARAFDEWCGASTDTVYSLEIDALCRRLTLLFFGNFRQDLTAFVLADLGIFKFERIELHAGSRPFRTRRQVEDFHQLYRARVLLYEGADLDEVVLALPAASEDCEWLRDRREKLRYQIGREYERAGAVGEAAEIYTTCAYPDARARVERLEARARGIMRRCATTRVNAPEFWLVIARSDEQSVERLVLDALAAAEPDATQVHYVENGLINSLFGLLCWPAIFAPIPGAFFHPFHHAPADIGSACFYARREPEFGRCFAELSCGDYKDTMRRRLVEKLGVSSPFVAWGLIDEALLETALLCFPPEHLARWFDWIARDISAHRSGFPDLVQFWPESGRYRLVEVKAPGDRLQESQRRFLEFSLREGMPVSVCRVRWAG